MNRLEWRFKELKRKALIPFITAGFPTRSLTKDLVAMLEDCGADAVELGVPFSDPLADGPTIQDSSHRSLLNGTSLMWVIETVKDIRKQSQIPLILMSYFNPIMRYGRSRFIRDALKVGLDGVVVPDLIIDEAREWRKDLHSNGISTIFLAAPTTPDSRIRKIASYSTPFLYYVSLTGVTGMRKGLEEGLTQRLQRIKRITERPVACGFGISSPEHVCRIAPHVDGIIVGSAIIKIIDKSKTKTQILNNVGKIILSFRKALDN